jgi:hypothetical protein
LRRQHGYRRHRRCLDQRPGRQTQLAVAAQMIKMNARADAAVVKLVDAAQQNLNQLANVANGIGGKLDITV